MSELQSRAYRGIMVYLRQDVDPSFAKCTDKYKRWSIAFPEGDTAVRYSHGYINYVECADAIDRHLDGDQA